MAASGSKYIEMVFGEVRHNLVRSIKHKANLLDIEVDPDCMPKEQVTEKQGNDRNVEWAARYAADFDESGELLGGRSDKLLGNADPGIVERSRKMLRGVLSFHR